MSSADSTLYYVHDPMCSWCWGYRPEWLKLQAALPDGVQVVNVLGGLAPDNDRPMTPEMRRAISGHWYRIEALLGTEFNFDFWERCQPRRDTWKACRAVIAAAAQGGGEKMVEAIQRAYYLRAMNPSEPETLMLLAGEIGLDPGQFRQDLVSKETEAELQRQLALRRALGVNGFPSLVLETGSGLHQVPVDYLEHRATLALIVERVA